MDILEPLRYGKEKIELEIYDWPDVSSMFVTTDHANQYLLHLIKEKNEEGRRLAMTEGIIMSNNNDKTIEKACDLLAEKYKTLSTKYPSLEGIYTSINAAPSMRDGAHQNWLYYSVREEHITRFEPNGPRFDEKHPSYPMYDLLECIYDKMDITWDLANNKTINYFNGCRATSTILALLDVMGIDMDQLSRIETDHYRALAYQVSESIRDKVCKMKPLPRKGRRTKGLLTYAAPIIHGEEEIEAIDFSKMYVKDLKQYLRDRGIKIKPGSRKTDLVQQALKSQNKLEVV